MTEIKNSTCTCISETDKSGRCLDCGELQTTDMENITNIIGQLEKRIAFEIERADYAWKNVRTIDKARAEDQKKLHAALDLLAIAYDNLNDLPIYEEWARRWCKKVLEILEKN